MAKTTDYVRPVDSDTLAEKVAAILSVSSNEPGINELAQFNEINESMRQIDQAYLDMSIPMFTTQTSNLRL